MNIFSEAVKFLERVIFEGGLTLPSDCVSNDQVSPTADIATTKIAQRALAVYPIDFTTLRVHDAMQNNLPGAGASDDLGLVSGTLGTNSPKLKTNDLKAATGTLYARGTVKLPPNYEDGQTVQIRIKGGMETTVADTSAVVDVQAYLKDRSGGVGSDICASAAQSINNLTAADKTFTITATSLTAGAELDVRFAIAITDGATGTAVMGAIGAIELLCDTRG